MLTVFRVHFPPQKIDKNERETERVDLLSHVSILVYERANRTDIMKRSTGMSHLT